MEAIFKHVKDNNMFGNRQHGFTKAKYAWLIAFYAITGSLYWVEGVVYVICLELSKAFDIVSNNKRVA